MRFLFKNTFSIIPHSKNSLFAKLFSLLFFGVLLDPSVSEAQCTSSSGTADVRVVTGSSDDATQQLVSPYTMTTGGSGLALMTTANYVGLRFPTVNIPQGATITSAYIEFTASATAATAVNPITIYGFDTTSTVGFTTTARDMKNRGLTGQTTSWTPGNWTSGTAYQTSSIVAIVQQIVNRGDWVANNSMGFIFEPTTGTNTRTAHSIESSTATTQDPRLVVTWQLDASITTMANVSGCFDSNGNTAGGTNQTTLQVIVDWKNRPGTQDIILKVQGQADFTIDPDVVTKPFIKNYTLTADATTKTVDANFSTTTTCTATQKTVTLPAGNCILTPCQSGNTGGTVWRDFANDGVKAAADTFGLAGVTVKVYDCNGVLLGTTTTDYQGQYTFSSFTPSVSNKIRLEFSSIAAPFAASAAGTGNGTTTQFVSATGCSYNLGVNDPSDYCQTNPVMATNCYVNGNNSTGTSGAADVLIKFNYDNTGLTPTPGHIGLASEAGTTWGLAYQKETKKLFSTAYQKRHAGFGPLGTGGIYVSDITAGTTTSFVNLNGLAGITTGTDPHTDLVGDNLLQSRDSASFHVVGKIAFGDMDISDDGKYLFVVNLNTRQIHKIFINNPAVVPTAANITTYTIPNPCGSTDNRPFALKYYRNKTIKTEIIMSS